MNIILFGPPGIGKSSVIAVLKAAGHRAIDLEDVYPNRVRFSLPHTLEDVIFGAADLNPKRKYANALKILLYADQSVYDQRRSARDAKQPTKRGQAAHRMDDWKAGTSYDLLLDTTKKSARDVARSIIAFCDAHMKGGSSP